MRRTDRKKDLIIKDKGENVARQKVEGMLTLQPEIMQAMIAGDRKPYMVAALVPAPEWCARSGDPCNFANLAHDHDYRAALGAAVERVHKAPSQIDRISLLLSAADPFAIHHEHITPYTTIPPPSTTKVPST